MQALLKDVDMAFANHNPALQPKHRELTAEPVAEAEEALEEVYESFESPEDTLDRKSPAALFGSQKIGQVVVPQQLQDAIVALIDESDKGLLHSDAKRLFGGLHNPGVDSGWLVQLDTKYRSRKQGERHADRDAIAFAAVVLPAHYAAVAAVLEHVKHRLGSSWEVERVIDWGAGAGTGLWASLFSFQSAGASHEPEGVDASQSTLRSYLGIDKRQAMVALAERIQNNITPPEGFSLQFKKTFSEEDNVPREEGTKTVALSAFTLSSLPTPLARKALVKEMWESGAHTLVLMDHNTKEGFESIAQAREYLLRQGRKEVEKSEAESPSSLEGAYVVAPCPHDSACPLLNSGSNRLVCGFNQRLQRPSFVRLTKHSGIGHEDIGYTYVVIQRGSRPGKVESQLGRVGLVGRWEQEAKLTKVVKELQLFDQASPEVPGLASKSAVPAEEPSEAEVHETLRQEAYHWPRLVFPPMKKSGHVILDSCTSEGKIVRMTIPKSQGKQPYYDARKSAWGDLFPHPPKNPPQERVVIRDVEGKALSVERDHIGKNSSTRPAKKADKKYSEHLASTIREAKKAKRRWERNVKSSVIWDKDD
ncbi:3-methyl-2-oxobutanoate hydroxymethyltransferase [Coprinopsis cinerea okayama7|uniref:3-methyl-2-oxobutanoate hydroxymethyltransferase n=1 Tax=Coprinopsis cinerea (strain Okayama-7 / 130 / ATCC MYA-4618 / FGSC 9003) TaxID=240176 RepID=A8N361_COPC7|nr:3-methyl-2-oxobutanoate hydroxymethyltransferase [Coprinopsis cinerea okayama7\|eukprot:XP_001829306.1 3-methyl-2-oxobutanoate hydroxymethyltransferase [Coprinopsis cinerea okayama7\